MEQDYWDVDDILAESQRLPCVFAIDVPGLGYLEGAGQSDIQKHTRVELPYWMAHMLAVYDIVTIQQPRAFGSRVRSALDASAAAVRLRDLLPYWYALALRLASLLDSDSMRDWLSKTYMGRLPRIYELSVLLGRTTSVTESATTGRIQDTSHLSSEMQEFMQGLEEGETTLLHAGQTASRTMQDYLAY